MARSGLARTPTAYWRGPAHPGWHGRGHRRPQRHRVRVAFGALAPPLAALRAAATGPDGHPPIGPPRLLTFDILGMVLDRRTSLEEGCRATGRPLGPAGLDRFVDAQVVLKHGPFLDYATVARRSLVEVVGPDDRTAAAIGTMLGRAGPSA